MLFEYADLEVATNQFNQENLIREGGFGKVYKGKLRYSQVAVKVLSDVRVCVWPCISHCTV